MSENGGTKHTGVPVKTLKKLLKKAGLKVSGKKATLTRRAKKARLLKGGGFLDNFKYASPEASKAANTTNLRTQSRGSLSSLKLPPPVLTPEQQKAKDVNDAYLKQQAADKAYNENSKIAAEQDYVKRNYTNTDKPSKTEFQRQVGNLFGQPYGGKNKRSRRR